MAEGNLPLPPESSPESGVSNPATSNLVTAPHAPGGTAKPQAVKKRRRRWPWVVLVLFLLLGLLVLLLPTLLGTGPGRSVVLGQVNPRLNGRLDVADWSLGWTSPITVSGLKVFDKAGV